MRFAIVIPFRHSNLYRVRAARRVLRGFAAAFPDTPLVLADHPGKPFSRAMSINQAVTDLDVDMFVACDADMLIPPESILEAVEMADAQVGLVNPFNAYRYLTERSSKFIIDHPSSDHPAQYETAWSAIAGQSKVPAVGGCNVFSRQTWELTGGMFGQRGLRCQDIIWDAMCETFAAPMRRVEGDALHLYHPKDEPMSSDDPGLLSRRDEMHAICDHRGDAETMREVLAGYGHLVP